jgi:hypothetical protein
MGPTFGIKGGAAGGGFSQVVPMEILNLHLTSDFHAVTAAHNMLSAVLDNPISSRATRPCSICTTSPGAGFWTSTTGPSATSSSALALRWMAYRGRRASTSRPRPRSLSKSVQEMRERLGRIVVDTVAGKAVTAEEIGGAGAIAVIMRDALKPNLMQTLENTPVLVHAGPFGNIAHGNSSVAADLIGIRTGDFLITEAGFGADMGAERFFNIKCRASGLTPDAAVVVTTVRALKAHSGNHKIVAGKPLPDALFHENPEEVLQGGANLRKQIENIRLHGVAPVVAINVFRGDHRPNSTPSGRSPSRWAPGRPSARTSWMAAGEPPSSPRRSPRRRRNRRRSSSSIPTTRRCGRRSRRSPSASTARMGWTTTPRLPARSAPTRTMTSAISRCASPRLTCPSRPISRSEAPDGLAASRTGGPRLRGGRGHLPDLR